MDSTQIALINKDFSLDERAKILSALSKTRSFNSETRLKRYVNYCYLVGERKWDYEGFDKGFDEKGKRKQIHHVIPKSLNKSWKLNNLYKESFSRVILTDEEHQYAHYYVDVHIHEPKYDKVPHKNGPAFELQY